MYSSGLNTVTKKNRHINSIIIYLNILRGSDQYNEVVKIKQKRETLEDINV
ncbi:MAG: hypothetical protein ACJAX4_001441 [Clostridium sp.]|jgi:hypothetical protein